MTTAPQNVVVPRVGGWSIPVTFRDANGNLVDLTAAGLVPVVDFYQPNFGLTTPCTVLPNSGPGAQAGQAVALVPASVVQTLLSASPGPVSLGGAFAVPTAGPCRVEAYVVDSQGTATPPVVAFLQPIDWRTADPSALPFPPAIVVPVGPAGAPGPKGDKGDAGQAGSADPQPVTLAGAAAAHQAVYLGPAGALVASCDLPAQVGAVLGLLLAGGGRGDSVAFSASGVLTDGTWGWKPGPIFLGLNGALTQQIPPTAAFVQQLAVALSPTSLRMAVRPATLIEIPAGSSGATYLDFAGGVDVLRAAVQGPGTPSALVATTPDGYLPTDLLKPVSIKASRLGGGPHLASIPNGTFEDGFDGWTTSTSGTAQVSVDLNVSAVGGKSAYLRCPAAGDVAALASSPVPVGEGVPVYVASRVVLRGGGAVVVLSAIFYDRNGNVLGQLAQVGTPLGVTTAGFAEFGGYLLPPAGARYAAASISNTAAVGAVGAINVDEVMIQRQACGPAAWQVLRAARPVLAAVGSTMAAFLATLGGAEAMDGTFEASQGAMPAPLGGILYAALSRYLQFLKIVDPDLTKQLAAIWAAATAILPTPAGVPAPPPIVVSAKTSQVISAVRPVLVGRGGSFSAFVTDYIGDGDATDGSWEALYVDPIAQVGGVFYARLLAYLTGPLPQGLAQPQDQSVADLAAAWVAALTY